MMNAEASEKQLPSPKHEEVSPVEKTIIPETGSSNQKRKPFISQSELQDPQSFAAASTFTYKLPLWQHGVEYHQHIQLKP